MKDELTTAIAALEQHKTDGTENMNRAVSEAILALRKVVSMIKMREKWSTMVYTMGSDSNKSFCFRKDDDEE